MLCDNVLLSAFALGKPRADDEALESALQDLAFKRWSEKV
jgi:hypothetical protein